MLLVLIGHSMRDEMRLASPVLDFIYRSVYIFHMSYFFWLSGYAYRMSRERGREPLRILARKIKSQFLPWCIYTLLIFFIFLLASRIPQTSRILSDAGMTIIPFPEYCLNVLQANNPWAYHLWFLYILLILTLIVSVSDVCMKGRTRPAAVLLLILSVIAMALQSLFSAGAWWRLVNYLILYLPMFCLGVIMWNLKVSDRVLGIWGLAGLAYIIIRVIYFSGFSGNSVQVSEPWLRFFVYFLALALLPGLMMLLNRILEKGWLLRGKHIRSFFTFLGRDSLILYLLHQPFCCAFLGLLLYQKLHVPAVLTMLICMIVSLVVARVVTLLLRRFHVRRQP